MVKQPNIRELPEENAQYDQHFASIGAAAGHTLTRRVDARNCDYITCECEWESKHNHDDMTKPFNEWITHAHDNGAEFGKRLLEIWHSQHSQEKHHVRKPPRNAAGAEKATANL
jgi:hypothetical protein